MACIFSTNLIFRTRSGNSKIDDAIDYLGYSNRCSFLVSFIPRLSFDGTRKIRFRPSTRIFSLRTFRYSSAGTDSGI